MKFMTTLNEIRACDPCQEGWRKLLSTLGKTKADDEPLSLLTILDSNGLDDAIWCARAFKGHDRDFRLFGVWAARQVQHLMTDPRSLNALDVAEQFANGLCDDAARAAARDAAGDAAGDAARDAAGDAARDAAGAAAGAAAGDAARAAAWAAAWAAAGDAAWDAAGAAAGDAAGDAQEKRLRQMIQDGEWIGSTAKI
nr:hypothetical protein [uncultured Pseudomonas sp.]